MSEVGFVTMGKTAGDAEVKAIGVGMLGYAFMGKAHSNAYKTLAYVTWQRVAATGVKHMCAFNYRFVPAVRLARNIIESGELGDIQHFRGAYLQEWGTTEGDIWRFQKEIAGSGSLGDLGAHVIDLARYLVGEIEEVTALTRTFIPDRDVDDAVEAVMRFESGAVGTMEASRFCPGRKNHFTWGINGPQ